MTHRAAQAEVWQALEPMSSDSQFEGSGCTGCPPEDCPFLRSAGFGNYPRRRKQQVSTNLSAAVPGKTSAMDLPSASPSLFSMRRMRRMLRHRSARASKREFKKSVRGMLKKSWMRMGTTSGSSPTEAWGRVSSREKQCERDRRGQFWMTSCRVSGVSLVRACLVDCDVSHLPCER
jgi:hypothetical protein